MKRILVVFTGGTIGCAPVRENEPKNLLTLSKPASKRNYSDYFLITSYLSRTGDNGVSFETVEPLNTLSENMTIGKWNRLLKALKETSFSNYDGIIITHGSDTLAYTSSLLGIVFCNAGIPIAVVSSNYDLYNPLANGHKNFEDAVGFICSAALPGVFVFYSYDLIRTTVYLGTRIMQSQPFVDVYRDVAGIDFGYMRDGNFVKNSLLNREMRFDTGNGEFAKALNGDINLRGDVLLINPYVGLDYSRIMVEGLSAVVHSTYHSFTFCAENDAEMSSSVIDFIKRCAKAKARVFFAPVGDTVISDKSNMYSSTASAHAANALFIPEISLECAYAKLCLAYCLFGDIETIMSFLNHEFFCEKRYNTLRQDG